MTTLDDAARLHRATSTTLELGYAPASEAASLSAGHELDLLKPAALRQSRVRQSHLVFDIAVLLALPILLLFLNDSWSTGWVSMPSGQAWVDAGGGRAALPAGWMINYEAESLDTPISWVDPYIYQSFFLDLKSNLLLHQELYGKSSYYSSRLPWLVLGNAVYSLAPPQTANLMLRLVLIYVATFSLYVTVRLLTSNDLAALLAALLLGVNTYFLWAVGWNYVDGFGIALILLMLAFLTKAATSEAWRLPLLLGGMAAATAVSINIFLALLMPSVLAWYLIVNTKRNRHGLIASVGLMIAGGFAGLAGFGLINLYLTGDAFDRVPQVSWVISSHAASSRPFYPEASWLVVPGLAAAASLVLMLLGLSQRLRRTVGEAEAPGVIAAGVFLLTLGIFACLELFTYTTLMEHPYYVSYVLPFAYLVVAAAIHLVSSAHVVRTIRRHLIVAGLAVCLVAPLALAPLRFMPGCPDGCLSSGWLQLLVVAALGLIAVALSMRSIPVGVALLVVFSLINVGVADQRVMAFSGTERDAMHNRASMVFDAAALVSENNTQKDMRFWIDLTDPFGWVYSAVAGQNLWNKRLVSLEFPKVRPKVELKPGDRVMLASATGDEVVLKANDALAPKALHLEVFERSRVQRGKDGFDVFLTTVMPAAQPESRTDQ